MSIRTVGNWGDLPRLPLLTATPTATANWLDAMSVTITEAPPRRRMVRPLVQQVDLKFVGASEVGTPDVDPAEYDRAGQAARATARPGSLLNVRV